MRYVSQLFQPIITVPKNAKIKNTEITCKSQKLLLECGLVRPTSAGLFTLLPLARRALDKLEALICKCMEEVGAQRISLPALTAASLWERTGRLDQGTELMQLKDRHGKRYLLAPTHEEAVSDLLADVSPLSYKQLPLLLYQTSNKYRDEPRPKHGALRAREFLMLDAYGAHASRECAQHTYDHVSRAYNNIFNAMTLPVHRVEAPCGDMGGSLSHEWQLCADAGEDTLAVCPSCSHAKRSDGERETCDKCGNEMLKKNSIEVGHTFILGTKYSAPLRAHFTPAQGSSEPLIMSCYGIGVTRLLAACVEALSSEKALRWPEAIAPYSAIVIGPKEGSTEWSSHGWDKIQQVGRRLSQTRSTSDVIIDDRHNLTIGKRLMMADRIGYPTIVVCGKSTLDTPPRYEVYRSTPDKDLSFRLLTLEELTHTLDPPILHEEETLLS